MTIVVTRDVASRYRGFLASVMPEIAPGVYLSPRLSKGVRERVWTVMVDWWSTVPGGSILLCFPEVHSPGGFVIRALGLPPVELAVLDGLRVVRRTSTVEHAEGEASA